MTEQKHTAAHATHAAAAAAAEVPEEAAPAPAPLAAGDVVSLCVPDCPHQCIDGCPALVIEEVGANGKDCICCWFGTDGAFYRQTFHASRLVRPEDHKVAKAAKAKADKAAKAK